MCSLLHFDSCFSVDCVGRSGGLDLLWKNSVDVAISGYSNNCIDAMISCGGCLGSLLVFMEFRKEAEDKIPGIS